MEKRHMMINRLILASYHLQTDPKFLYTAEISYESVSHTLNIIQNTIMAQDHKDFIGICCHDTKIPSINPSQLVDAKIAMKSSLSPSLPWLSRGPTSHTSFRIPSDHWRGRIPRIRTEPKRRLDTTFSVVTLHVM